MSLYSDAFASQLRKWVQNESLIPLQPGKAISNFLGEVQIFKSTIEPRKPRGIFHFLRGLIIFKLKSVSQRPTTCRCA